ncbi:MAG: hypothetical protein P4L51_28960 [Puia sp.]|nr:hypothetical protein [Puia sp.]
MKNLLLLVGLHIIVLTATSQTSYTWNGATSTAWSTATNWTPNGIPGAADNVTIVTGSNTCALNAARSITNITVTSGTLDLGGFTLSATGNAVFTAGTIKNGTLNVNAATSGTAVLTNTTFNANAALNITTGAITLNGGTYAGPVTLNQTGTANTTGSGGAIFDSTVSITNSGSGYYRTNGYIIYGGTTTFLNSGSGYFLPELIYGSIYNGNLTVTNTSVSQNLRMAYAGATSFNGNIVVNNTGGANITFCEQLSATAVLANNMTIGIGSTGFSVGNLSLPRFTQTGATPQTLIFTGTAGVTLGPSSSFGGNFNCTSPTLYLNGCVFSGTTNITKTGTTGDFSNGGNTFNGTSNITNSGSSYLVLGNNSPDTWNSDVVFTDNGSERLLPCWATAGNQFNGNIYVNTSGSAQGIQFCGGNATATATLAAGKTIQPGSIGLTAGYLYLKQFTQLGNTAINLTGTGSSVFYFGPYSNFGGSFTATAPDIWAQGATYNSAATFTKTGGSSNHNNQYQNIFNSTCTINQQSSTGYFMLGYNSNDQFNDNITVTSTGSGGINLGWSSGTGTPTLAAGKTILVGAAGFSAGYLNLNTFTQLGSAAINLAFSGTNTGITFARSSVIGGNLVVTSPDIYLSGCTFNGTSAFTKTGAGGDYGQGGNVFNGVCSITNNGSSYFLLGNTSPDTWNADVTFTNNGSERLLPCWASAGNQFNGNINVNTSGSAQGIQFCGGNTTATATLAAGMTIQAGSTGLTAGYLYLKQFTQSGNAPINLTGTGTSVFYFGPYSNFGGAVTATAPDILAQGATYNGAASFTKTGGSYNHNNQYQNIFNSTCTINQQSNTGYFMLGYNSNDQFNDNITLTCTGSGGIYLGWTSGTGTPTLAAGKTILVGAAGYSAGFLSLNTFTQLGNAAMNLVFSGTSTPLIFAHNSVIGGDLVASSSDVYLNGCTFNGASTITKTGANGNYCSGGNVFNGICSITNSGTSFFLLGNNYPDTWNNDVIFTDNGSERILPCWASTGNQFNGNIIVNTSGSAQGIQFCGGNATATATLAAGKSVQAGSTGLTAGYLILKQFTQLGNTPVNLTLSSTATYLQFGPASSIGGNAVTSSPSLFFNGCTFSGTVNSTKTGASNDASIGNNIFNGATTITNAGSGYLLFGNGNADQFNTVSTFNNTGSSNLYVAYNSPNNIFGDVATFNNTPSGGGGIYVSWYSTGTTMNGNVVVSSTGGTGVQFSGGNNTATTILSVNSALSIGSAGFSCGTLLLRQFTQQSASADMLPLTGTGVLTFGPASSFAGNVTSSSPSLFFNGCVFNGTTNCTKTGSTGDNSTGENTFNGTCSITNSGSGVLLLGNSIADIWNNDVTFTDNGSERLLLAWASPGNQFNGNIYVNTGGGAQGIWFCGGNTTATATQAAGMTIQAGTAGLNAGYLILKQFIQLGNAPVNLTLGNTASYLQFGPASAIGGNTISSSPGLLFNGCTFSGTVTSTKTGASNDASTGNNVFNGPAVMTNAGSGYLIFGNGNADQFNAMSTFNNTGSNNIYVAYNSPNNLFGGIATFNNTPTANTQIYVSQNSGNTVFNDNIVVTSTNGQGVQFCTGNTSANATLVAGKTISVGAGGFSAGTLLLRQFTQSGSTPQSLTLTGTGTLTFGPSSSFGGNTTTASPALFFNGCNFGGTVTSVKNGPTNDASSGNNTFNGAFVITNTGAGYFMMGNGNPDLWQSTATFNNQSAGQHMYPAYNSTGNVFNGDVTFNNQPASAGLWIYVANNGTSTQFNGNINVTNVNGGGVYFENGTGSATLAAGKTIGVGSGGFNSGGLIFRNFTQAGPGTAQNITTTGTSYIQYGTNSTFNGALTSSSPGLLFSSSVFNGTVNCTKTGTTNDQSPGNNIFNASGTFTNSGTGYLMMTNNNPDTYNGDVSFVQTNTGAVYPNYNGNSTYAGNVSVTSLSTVTFGQSSGTATFTGTAGQNINATAGTPTPVFTRLVINNTGSGVTLNTTSINVSVNLALSSGLLNTSSAHILTMLNGSSTAAGTALSTSYVNGPMKYQKSGSGTSTLNFPIGTSPDCRPFVLTVNHSSNSLYTYTAQLFDASAAALNYTLPPSADRVSEVHYYTIGRTDASNNNQPTLGLSGSQTIQIFFGANDIVSNGSTVTIVKNTYTSPTQWIDIGGAGAPPYNAGANLVGSVTSTSSPVAFTSFSTFALADKSVGNNVLPIGLLYFNAKADNNSVDLAWATSMETNNSYFTVERSRDGMNFDSIQRVNTEAFHGNSTATLYYTANDPSPNPGNNYYRLKQTDLDGTFTYSSIAVVNFSDIQPISVYPNPSAGTVYISGINPGETSLKINWYDLSGRLLLQGTIPVQNGLATLNTHFTDGIYLLTFMGSDGIVRTQKIMIRK